MYLEEAVVREDGRQGRSTSTKGNWPKGTKGVGIERSVAHQVIQPMQEDDENEYR